MSMVIRAARPDEAEVLSALAVRSKGHWGYDEAFLASCRVELAVRPEQCDGVHLQVAAAPDLRGFYLLEPGELSALFVDPAAIGQGVGSALLAHAVATARDLGWHELTIDSDPYAEPFYLHHGARRVDTTPSNSIPGRLLPQLLLRL
ncbi:GNAT family N-acetyltransferase [Kribbella sp. NBC_01245]|uniref:GNAT family N-acetyltransferase n=1 Tax=Kribbella sp. NBC_01245 TaxID=2903578 RepID=UPI002E2CB172|nr:GNAT family N-acetyltransferase [Kribbella sp. NBC_01245]